MDEDTILDAAIRFLQSDDWHLSYRTRRVANSAIAGVDAILFNARLSTFRLVDAKGESNTPAVRSTAFANCLGTLLKRIRFQSGYLHLETKALFTPPAGMSTDEFRENMRQNAVHRNCEYWLVFPTTMRQTLLDTVDPTLAGLLRLFILLVGNDGDVERFRW
jgi:hypothetical protein